MKSTHLVSAILVLMTSYVSCLATAGGQSKASETQHLLIQQSQQPQQQASSLSGAAETVGNSKQQEGFIGRSMPAAEEEISVSSRARPHFVGKRLSRPLSNQWYPTSEGSTEQESEVKNVGASVHSVAKRAIRPRFVGKRLSRYEARKAPWFIGKRDADFDNSEFDDDVEDEWNRDIGDGDFLSFEDKRDKIPRFIGKRDSYFEGYEDEATENRDIPPFNGKRSDRSRRRPVFVGRRAFSNPRRPVFVGKRSVRTARRPVFVGKRPVDFANDELFFGSNQLYDGLNDKKGLPPRFVGRRSQESDIGDLVDELSRRAELRALRARITKEKRKYAPRFIGKRDEVENENTR